MTAYSGRALALSTARNLWSGLSLEKLTWEDLTRLCPATRIDSAETGPVFGIDPRNQDVTLFGPGRATRPTDNNPDDVAQRAAAGCVICNGTTTPIIDLVELSDGFTFINANLYPIISPQGSAGSLPGAHLLHWTSNRHDEDWPDLEYTDRITCLRRIAALEHALRSLPDCPIPPEERHVSIIKNSGRKVGGSLSHGHQQIALTAAAPRRVVENRGFLSREGSSFAAHMLNTAAADLIVREFGTGSLLVPYYMRRPYDLLYPVQNGSASYLHELSDAELGDMGSALALGITLMESVLVDMGLEIGYNILFHTGCAGIYLEFLPSTQQNGGFEQLGLNACQALPHDAASRLRRYASGVSDT